MPNNYENLSVTTISGGDVIKQVDYQLEQAIKNCLDPNTLASAKRAVTLKITMKPTNDRTMAELEFTVDAKMPGDAPGVDTVHILREKAKGFVPKAQLNIEQLLEDVEEKIDPATGEVLSIKGK